MKILRQLMILSLMITLGLSFLVVNSSFLINPNGFSLYNWSLAGLCLFMLSATFISMHRLSLIEAKDINQKKIDLIISSLELHKDKLDLSSTNDDEIKLEDIVIGPQYNNNSDSNSIQLS